MHAPSPRAPEQPDDRGACHRVSLARPAPAFLAYGVVFAALCLPWLATATHAIPINTPFARGDTRLLTWILWWVATAVTGDPYSVYDAPINYPAPAQLTGSEHFGALQLVFLPVFRTTGNPILAINAILFLAYPLGAFAMCRLLLALGFAPGVAWVTGLVFVLGANQVPAQAHQLHVLPFYLPATALALHRLREKPGARNALFLGAIFLLACFSAYYTVAVVLPVVALWGAAELLRRRPRRVRFVLLTAGIVLSCLATLAAASVPYLSRAVDESSADTVQSGLLFGRTLLAWYVLASPVAVFGATSIALGVAGCAGLPDRRLRGLTLLALALVATGLLLVQGVALDHVAALLPSPFADLLEATLRFVRMVIRYAAIAGLGLGILGAVALQLAARHLPRAATTVLLVATAAVVVAERGRLLWRQETETSGAWTTEATVYDTVGRVTAEEGPGPLLELPLSSFGYSLQPEAMMGAMRHRLPLITGHTGYLPAHRHVVDAAALGLPDEKALQELVDLTRVRWILLRPDRYWASARVRERLLRALTAVDGVGPERTIEGWTLLPVYRAPVRPERFAAIARGEAPGPSRDPATARPSGADASAMSDR